MMGGYTSGRNPNARNADGISDIGISSEVITKSSILPLQPDVPIPDSEWWDVEYLPKAQHDLFDRFGFIRSKARKDNPDIEISYDLWS